jgi:uncharacterized membrane-anchored protein
MGKKTLLSLFVLMVIFQLYVPAKMIYDREQTIAKGTEFKFETTPIDPTDPFRGKYITLSFSENTFEISDDEIWKTGEPIYVSVLSNDDGLMQIGGISQVAPDNHQNYVKAKVQYVMDKPTRKVFIEYPFNRYYMEESKAYDAERLHVETQVDSTNITYAVVNVRNGDAVLMDVRIDGVSISDIVLSNRQN